MQIPPMIDCDPKFFHLVHTACVLSNARRESCQASLTRDRSKSFPHRLLHALIPAFNNLTSGECTGGSGEDFNTKSLPLSLPACVTAYQGPVSDVGNPGPCPPNPSRPGRLFCPTQTENYRTGTARVDITEAPGSLCPLCGREERGLDINLPLFFTRRLSSSLPFSPRKPYFWALHPIKAKSSDWSCNSGCSWRKHPLRHSRCGLEVPLNE